MAANNLSKISFSSASIDNDNDSLRKELQRRDFNPGPITESTRNEQSQLITSHQENEKELENTLRSKNWSQGLNSDFLDVNISDQFSWREEHSKFRDSSESEKSKPSSNKSSKLFSLSANLVYDPVRLRTELQCYGYNPGPITATTIELYLRKLFQLQKEEKQLITSFEEKAKVIPSELEKTLRSENWCQDLTSYKLLDKSVSDEFSCTDHRRTWREGHRKSSFTYLLLDPRVTNNLPCRSETLASQEIWKTFLLSIFYVGKGKRSRPYAHLYEAAHQWNSGNYCSTNKKIQRIIDIWKANKGVVCLHIFQNVIPVEAYTREAAMISALGLSNLENSKDGEFYGIAATWPTQKKEMYGVFLLHKALVIFLHEGERELGPEDLD